MVIRSQLEPKLGQFLLHFVDVPEFDDSVRVADGQLVAGRVPVKEPDHSVTIWKRQQPLALLPIPDFDVMPGTDGDPWSAGMECQMGDMVCKRFADGAPLVVELL